MTNQKPKLHKSPVIQQSDTAEPEKGRENENCTPELTQTQLDLLVTATRWLARKRTAREILEVLPPEAAVKIIHAHSDRLRKNHVEALEQYALIVKSARTLGDRPKIERDFIRTHLAEAKVLHKLDLTALEISKYLLKKRKFQISGAKISRLLKEEAQNKAVQK